MSATVRQQGEYNHKFLDYTTGCQADSPLTGVKNQIVYRLLCLYIEQIRVGSSSC